MVSALANDGDAGEAAAREGRHYGCGVQAEAAGAACGLATHSESDIHGELYFLLRDLHVLALRFWSQKPRSLFMGYFLRIFAVTNDEVRKKQTYKRRSCDGSSPATRK